MKKYTKLGILAVVLVTPTFLNLSFSTISYLEKKNNEKNVKSILVEAPIETSFTITKLWETDLILSENAVIFFTENNAQFDQALYSLCENKAQLNRKIQSSYGNNTRKKFAELMNRHIFATFDLAIARQNSDDASIEKSNKNWIANAEEISFLIEKSETNNRLSKMTVMMNDHSKQLNSTSVDYLNPTTEKIHESTSKPVVIAAEISEEKITKSLPKKFEGGKIKSVYK